MSRHLDERALEALATGRDDLLRPDEREHLATCIPCRSQLEATREEVEDASVALRRLPAEVPDLDAMVSAALAEAPPPVDVSRGSLRWGAAVGLSAAAVAAVGVLPDSVAALSGAWRFGWGAWPALSALDRAVEALVPGGWPMVAVLGLLGAAALASPVPLLGRLRRVRSGAAAVGGVVVMAAILGGAPSALAYRVEGAFPADLVPVTLDVDREPRSAAIRRAARSAGLDLAMTLPPSLGDPDVTLQLQERPLSEVLEALLGDADVVVEVRGSILTIRPDADPEAPVPRNEGKLRDRSSFGESVEVGPDEEVRNVFTMGGDTRVRGRAFGDVVTMGGNAEVEGSVLGDVVTMGGHAEIEGDVLGDVATMGGDITVRDGGHVYGDIHAMGGEIEIEDLGRVDGDQTAGSPRLGAFHEEEPGPGRFLKRLFERTLKHALLFLLGLVMLGVWKTQFITVRRALAERPLFRGLMGLVGLVVGVILTAGLVVTIIGIPAALGLILLLFAAGFVGSAAGAWWLGTVLPWGEERPVVQLGIGVGLLFLLSFIPVVGDLASCAVTLAGLGAVIATRFGSREAPPRRPPSAGPFR
ncbi:MAG: polymer-forming cytoskeletal protein [Sandaracinaceae bacterium]